MKELGSDNYFIKAYYDAKQAVYDLYKNKNHKLFAPTRFPNSKNPTGENFQKQGFIIYPHEAIAMRILFNEATTYCNEYKAINDNNKDIYDADLIDRLCEFGNRLGDAASVSQKRITNTTFSDDIKGTFDEDDDRRIGKRTTTAIIESILKTTDRDIKSAERVAKRMEGARLAQLIYLKVLLMDKTSR